MRSPTSPSSLLRSHVNANAWAQQECAAVVELTRRKPAAIRGEIPTAIGMQVKRLRECCWLPHTG